MLFSFLSFIIISFLVDRMLRRAFVRWRGRGTWKTLQQGNIQFLGNVIDGAIAGHLLIVILIFARDW
jgi:hypothetical protein